MMIDRLMEKDIRRSLRHFPVTAITGPRQCGKTTLAKRIIADSPQGIYLDLELPSDAAKLTEAELFFRSRKGKPICLDEIQRRPDLFPLIRALVDEWNAPGAFLILGSASRDLLRQSSESLAGRISYLRLTPFLWEEIREFYSLEQYLSMGAFPKSLLLGDPEISYKWREDFIATFLERDIPQWTGAAPAGIRRLWRMLAHLNGQTPNYTRIGSSLGVSDRTVRNHIDLLSDTYMLDVIPPFRSNLGKRLIKAPKIYLSDTGITAALLGLGNFEDMLGHPGYGALWEQMVLANLRGNFPSAEISFYRTAAGAEMDFTVALKGRMFAVECKASLSPALTRGAHDAIRDISPERTFVVAPVEEAYPMAEGIDVIPLARLREAFDSDL
ncbi:MAG: ATP-binding protein [Clostridiales Family XIII bacterium]|jgi:predicted AAA+ superfamily ATPase|nr:ATP-binding protein [Clostridiales Family XIII bacterium]